MCGFIVHCFTMRKPWFAVDDGFSGGLAGFELESNKYKHL